MLMPGNGWKKPPGVTGGPTQGSIENVLKWIRSWSQIEAHFQSGTPRMQFKSTKIDFEIFDKTLQERKLEARNSETVQLERD